MIEYRTLIDDPDYRVGDDGSAWSQKLGEWRPLKTRSDKDGYLHVKILGKRRMIHTLVLEQFVGPRPPGMKGRHLNDIKMDNRPENLAWGTQRQNFEDAVANGLIVLKLDAEKAREAVRLHSEGKTMYEIGGLLGVSQVAIHKVLCGKLWAEATGIKPKRRDDFEGPGRAAKIHLLDTWGWDRQKVIDFLGVSAAEVRGVLTGRSWGRVTGRSRQVSRSQVLDDLSPEVLRLRAEGWTMRRIGKQLGISESSVVNIEKRRRA